MDINILVECYTHIENKLAPILDSPTNIDAWLIIRMMQVENEATSDDHSYIKSDEGGLGEGEVR